MHGADVYKMTRTTDGMTDRADIGRRGNQPVDARFTFNFAEFQTVLSKLYLVLKLIIVLYVYSISNTNGNVS